MTEITDLSGTDASNTTVGGFSITDNLNTANIDDVMRVNFGMLGRVNAGTNPVADTWTFGDPADLTKRVRLDAGGITTGTTRVLSAPNFDGVLYSPTLGTAIDDDDIDGSNILTLPTDGSVFAMSGTQDVDEIASSVINRVVFRHTSTRTFTHHSTNLICPDGVDLTVFSGETTEWLQYASGDWINISAPLRRGAYTSETATTSGTSHDVTGIPEGVNWIEIILNGVSGSGTSIQMIQIGDSGGIEATGYSSQATTQGSPSTSISTSTSGFLLAGLGAATYLRSGIATLRRLTPASDTWVFSLPGGNGFQTDVGGGVKTLSSTLDRIRLTHVNGTDTFDAGSFSVVYGR